MLPAIHGRLVPLYVKGWHLRAVGVRTKPAVKPDDAVLSMPFAVRIRLSAYAVQVWSPRAGAV